MSVSQGAQDTLVATPPTLVTAGTLLGWTPEQWLLYATLFYTALAIVHKVWTMWKDFRGRK